MFSSDVTLDEARPVRVCPSQSDSSETIEVTIIEIGTVTASDMLMHHVFNYIDLDLHSKSHKILIINIINVRLFPKLLDQSIPIKFAVKIVRLNVYVLFSQSDDLALHSRSQLRLKLDTC